MLINHLNAIKKLNIYNTNYEKDVEEIVYNSKEYYKKQLNNILKNIIISNVLTTILYLYLDLKDLYIKKIYRNTLISIN